MSRYNIKTNIEDKRIDIPQKYLLIVIIILLFTSSALTFFLSSANSSISKTKSAFQQQIVDDVSLAIDQMNKLETIANSSVDEKLAMIRQYVYSVEQMHLLSLSLFGEKGRFAPNDAFPALYNDLKIYSDILRGATKNTLEIRSLLSSHLNSLYAYVIGEYSLNQ